MGVDYLQGTYHLVQVVLPKHSGSRGDKHDIVKSKLAPHGQRYGREDELCDIWLNLDLSQDSLYLFFYF